MEETRDRPITRWSDDQLLAEYRSSGTGNGSDGEPTPDRSEVTEELLRRGLELPDEPSAQEFEDVEWSGQAGGEDPGSGALPKPF